MKKILLVLFSVLCGASNLQAQQLKVFINNSLVKDLSTYEYRINFMKIEIGATEGEYKVVSGKLMVYDKSGRDEKYSSKIYSSFIDGKKIVEYALGGTKVILTINSIQNIKTGATTVYNKTFTVNLGKDILYKEDPFFDFLINGSIRYKESGINPDTIRTVKLIQQGNNIEENIEIIHARGQRPVQVYKKTITGLEADCSVFKNSKSQPGDRFIISFVNTKTKEEKLIVIPIK